MRKNNKLSHHGRFGFSVLAASVLTVGVPSIGQANVGDALNFEVGSTITYDDNLFRIPANRAVLVPGKSSRSDMITTTFAGVRIDKPYSLQRFQLDLTAKHQEYRTYSFLSFSALDYRAAWLWSLTPQLTGTVSADRTQSATNYADFTRTNQRNIQTIDNRRLTADWAIGGAWHLIGGGYQTRVDNSGNFTEVGNYVQDTAEAGVRYVSAADNSLALVRREARGEYSGRTLGAALLDTRYDQSETELRGLWKITGHSSLDARLGYLDRTHEHYAQRDYSGAVGRLSYLWAPTGKLQFTLAAGRDLYSYQNNFNSYYSYDYLSLMPAWLVSAKTTIRLKLDIGERDYQGSGPLGSTAREDTVRAAQLSVAWRPTQTIDVGAHLTREQRSSNIAGQSYHDNIAGVSASVRF